MQFPVDPPINEHLDLVGIFGRARFKSDEIRHVRVGDLAFNDEIFLLFTGFMFSVNPILDERQNRPFAFLLGSFP